MEKPNAKRSCWTSNETSASIAEKDLICPVCNGKTQQVKALAVKHFAIDKDKILEDVYNICLNEQCEVVYFNLSNNFILKKSDIKIPIWFKQDADPRYICYCNKVTEEQIIDAVLKHGAKNIKDIIRLTGAMKNGKCEINNPLGKCCSPYINQTINKALLMLGSTMLE